MSLNFYEGKLSYSHIRWFYEQYNNRNIANFMIHSGVMDIAEDDEFLTEVIKYLKVINDFIEMKSLPPEKKFFKERGYKTQELHKDMRAYSRMRPGDKSIITVLDFYGILGSNFIRYLVNRLFFLPFKEEVIRPSRDEVLLEIKELFFKIDAPEDIDQELKILQKEFKYKSELIGLCIEQNKKHINRVQTDKEKLKTELIKRLDIIDNETLGAITELDDLFNKELKETEAEIIRVVDEFKEKEMTSLKKIQELKDSLNAVLVNIENRIKETKPISKVEYSALLKKIELYSVSLDSNIVTKDDFEILFKKYGDLFDKLELLIKSYKEVPQPDKLINFDEVEKYLITITGTLDGNLEKYNKVLDLVNNQMKTSLRKISSKLVKLDTDLKLTTSNFLDLNKTCNSLRGNLNEDNR